VNYLKIITKVQSLVDQKDVQEKAPDLPSDYQMTWKRLGHDPWVPLQNIWMSILNDLKGRR
jgi:DNA-binding ferritin-like protein (Dps family)